jgi:6-phosphogluconolactonase
VESQNASIAHHGTFRIAIAGSEIHMVAAALFASSSNLEERFDFTKWSIFHVDECAVPLDDEKSNLAILKAEIIDKVPIRPENDHSIDYNLLDDLDELSDAYE